MLYALEGVFVKQGVLGLLEWRINLDIASHLLNEITLVHAIWYGLDVAPNDLNQVLED